MLEINQLESIRKKKGLKGDHGAWGCGGVPGRVDVESHSEMSNAKRKRLLHLMAGSVNGGEAGLPPGIEGHGRSLGKARMFGISTTTWDSSTLITTALLALHAINFLSKWTICP